jgi:DNA-binding IclR family transcriptional regulator
MEPDVTNSPRSLARLLGLFEAMAAAPRGLTLAEISLTLSSPKSSLLNLLRPLVVQGFLQHDEGRYRLGPAMFRLAAEIMASRKFPNLVRPFMQDLVERGGETVFLTVIDREAQLCTYIERIESPHAVRYVAPIGQRPLYCSAAGLLLLAYQDEEWRKRYLAHVKLKPLTPHTVVDPKRLRRNLAEIHRRGYSISISEAVMGAAGLAAPIFDADGGVAAALLIGAPADRFEGELPQLIKLTTETAARASAALGYSATGAAAADEPPANAQDTASLRARPAPRKARGA